MERELELARREIEMLHRSRREEQSSGTGESRQRIDDGVRVQSMRTGGNVAAIADLLGYFDGKSENYDIWEERIKLLKATYQLEDDSAKLVIGMRLKGRALEWLHSKPEYVGMSFDTLLTELRGMFPSSSE